MLLVLLSPHIIQYTCRHICNFVHNWST